MRMVLEEENRALRILAEGCRKHPAYRARRRPGIDGCKACDAMYDAAQTLIILDAGATKDAARRS